VKKYLYRLETGNMLVFSTVITVFLVTVLAFFGLCYVRLLGSNQEQRSAIEAASLSAARDLSTLAVDTDDCGWISLSDSAPTGDATAAGDNYNVPVRGINSILATNRLDLIIANELNDANLKEIIKFDLTKIKAAQKTLAAELEKSIQPGYTAKNTQGNPIDIYGNAEKAYKENQIRMSGSSSYVKDSLKLYLGSLTNGGPTNTPLPNPSSKAFVANEYQQNDFYKSYVNISFDNQDFVFAGIGNAIQLVDPKQWVFEVPGLPYQLRTIVKAEADQHLNSVENPNGYNLHAVACAQPANVVDPKPTPGALTFSFPDGIPPEIRIPNDMMTNSQLNTGDNCSFSSSKDGDYPIGKPVTHISDLSWPYPSLDQSSGNVFRQALADWWRRAGAKLNISSAVAMITNSDYKFVAPAPANVDWKTEAIPGDKTIYNLGPIPHGSIHIYRVDSGSGKISYQSQGLTPINYSVAGENQLYSENIDAIKSKIDNQIVGPFTFPNTGSPFNKVTLLNKFDVYIRDQVYQPGCKFGGRHAGEPMDFLKVVILPTDLGGHGFGARPVVKPKSTGLPPAVTNQSDFAETAGFPDTFYNCYSVGSSGKTIRPTYRKNGMAVDIRFRRQVDTGTLSSLLGFAIGYVGEKYGNDVPAILVSPSTSGNSGDHNDDSNNGN